ncbi:MAG: type II CAAX endopeptidase family protein [Actinobacteria bacterium]|nr:type II CAAX endopeptidase family protein [Actinomycetota bacterium]
MHSTPAQGSLDSSPPADYPGCPVTVEVALSQGRVLRSPRWGLGDVFIMLGATVLVGFVASSLIEGAGATLGVTVIIGGLLGWASLAGWPLLITRLRGNGPRIDLGLRLTWHEFGWGVVTGILVLVLASILTLISTAIFGTFDSAAGEAAREIVTEGNQLTVVAFALMLMVGAPIAEELAFRGLLFAGLRKRGVRPVLTVVITAVAFALFHFEPMRLGILIVIGLVLGVARARSGSLGVSIVAHAVNNAPGAVFIILGLPG